MHESNIPAPILIPAAPKPAPASTDAAAAPIPTSDPSPTSAQPGGSESQPETLNPATSSPTGTPLEPCPTGRVDPRSRSSCDPNSKPETNSVRPRWKKFVRRRGRPTLLTEDVADAMYEAILDFGVTDSRAALLAHVSTSTVSRWKQEDPTFADFLETARTEFECGEVTKIRNARRRDGQFNPQNSKWLLERTNPETWGRHATKRLPSASQPQAGRGVLPPDANASAQQSNSTPNIPEIPHPASPIPQPAAHRSTKQSDLHLRAETSGDRHAPLTARITPAAPFNGGSHSAASTPHDVKEFFASLSSLRAA